MIYTRFIALGDSYTEGMSDEKKDGNYRGWADRVADVMTTAHPDFTYANLSIRGKLVKQVLEANDSVECYGVPRVNTVKGLTEEHIKTWHWRVDEKGRVNWPDYQTRICKNIESIQWVGKVHERLEGWKTSSIFPAEFEDWALYHPKDIQRQEQQNSLYNTI